MLIKSWTNVLATVLVQMSLQSSSNDFPIRVSPIFDGSVQINSEQIELGDFGWDVAIDDRFTDEIYPGASKIEGGWLPIKRNKLEDITTLVVRIDEPHNLDYDSLGESYELWVDMTAQIFEAYPEELR